MSRQHSEAHLAAPPTLISGVQRPGYSGTHDLRVAGNKVQTIDDAATDNDAPGTSSSMADTTAHSLAIDGRGLLAVPGCIDLYGRLREPGQTRKGSLQSELGAALRAGIVSVACAPDTTPVIDNVATVELIQHRAASAAAARVIPIAGLTQGLAGEQLSELSLLQAAGCPLAGQADRPITNLSVLYSAMEYAASFDLPLMLTPRDAWLAREGCAHAGAMASRLGLPGIPVAAETAALAQLLELTRDIGCRVHVSRLSSARAVAMIRDAKEAGLNVTADVGLHHLFFTDAELAGFDARFHSAVPFRSATDRQALQHGVTTGVIDAICSDHAPHDSDARLAPFPGTEPGLSAYDFWLPLLLALPELLDLPLTAVFERVSATPASILDQAVNAGDLILIDPDAAAIKHADELVSAGRNTPLAGCDNVQACCDLAAPLRGVVTHAFVSGELRYVRDAASINSR